MRARMVLGFLIGGGGLLAVLVWPGTLLGQSQPKPPVPLPAPKAAPASPATGSGPAGPAAAPEPTPVPPGARDPFDPLVKKPAPGEGRKLQEIAGLKLVGVIWDARNRVDIRALVETPEGLGYYLRVNEEKFGGKVLVIERDRVQFSVREDLPGGITRDRTVDLKLAQPVLE